MELDEAGASSPMLDLHQQSPSLELRTRWSAGGSCSLEIEEGEEERNWKESDKVRVVLGNGFLVLKNPNKNLN